MSKERSDKHQVIIMDTHAAPEVGVEIRPGVFRPDWSAVTTPAAAAALKGRTAARETVVDKWAYALEDVEDLVWRTVLRLYAKGGRPPGATETASEVGMTPGQVEALLGRLQSRDLIGLDATEAIRHAYPFTEIVTGHRVELSGRSLNALCAVDALGVGSMYRCDVAIESSCCLCDTAVRVTTTEEGRALRSVEPAGARVWYDFAFSGSAASSCCTAIAFFCSDAHLQQWHDAQKPPREGAWLTMDEALEMGRAIFGPVLTEAKKLG